MRAWLALAAPLLLAGCGVPTSPSPTAPSPATQTITIQVTDTVTGAQLDAPTHSVSGLPAQVTLSRDGYISRTTWITTTMATVDLLPEAGFDLDFYRQLARGGLDNEVHELRVLAASPRIYL
jgi:hypothetical protein